jgi:hypothetical protein
MKILFLSLLLLLCSGLILPQKSIDIPDYFYKRFEGKIGDSLNIQMNLTRMDSVLDGNYYDNDISEPICFQYYSYIRDDGTIHIEEEGGYDEQYNTIITGIFDGKFTSQGEITGTWLSPDSSESYDFVLNENYPAGSGKFEIKQMHKDYGKSDYSDYAASSELSYPVMIDFPDQTVQQKINSFITDFYVNGSMQGDNGYADINDRMESFIDDYRNDIEADSELFKDYKPIYEDNQFTSIAYNSDSIISLEISEYIFTGGAHGNSSFALFSFNLVNGEQITLDDIFKGNYKPELNKVGERIFREHYQADSSQSLYDQGFFGFENGFALNENFDLYKGGIKFQFNPYEAGAYVLGAPEVFIPWSEIRDIIRDDSPLRNLLR